MSIKNRFDAAYLPEFPFQKKVFTAYSLAMQEALKPQMDILREYNDPSEAWVMKTLYGKDAFAYQGVNHILAYSRLRKDLTLFKLISSRFNLGTIEFRYGPALYTNIVETTDERRQSTTDMNLSTDMSTSGYPVLVLLMDYSYNSSCGVDSRAEVYSRYIESGNLISLVKPVRIAFVPLQRPNYILSRFNSFKLKTSTVPYGDFDSLTDEQIKNEYKEVLITTNGTSEVTLLYSTPRKRVYSIFSDSVIEKITLVGATMPDIEVEPEWEPEIFYESVRGMTSNFNKFLCRICFNLSNDPSLDTFKEVLNV